MEEAGLGECKARRATVAEQVEDGDEGIDPLPSPCIMASPPSTIKPVAHWPAALDVIPPPSPPPASPALMAASQVPPSPPPLGSRGRGGLHTSSPPLTQDRCTGKTCKPTSACTSWSVDGAGGSCCGAPKPRDPASCGATSASQTNSSACCANTPPARIADNVSVGSESAP